MIQIAVLSALVGGAYAAVRLVLAAPLFSLAMVGIGSGALIHEDGIDFVLLGPLPVTVGGLVAAGAVGCVAIVLATEAATRWAGRRLGVDPSTGRVARALATTAAAVMVTIAFGGAIRAIGTVQRLAELRRALGVE